MGRKIWKFIKRTLFVLSAVFVGLIIFFVIVEIKEESVLKNELTTFTNKDLALDNFTIKIKTKGDYAYVEKVVKKYYKDLSDNVKEINYYLNNNDFLKILSAEQLLKDRPSYSFSHASVKTTKNNINKVIKNIENLCDEKTIKDLLDKKKITDGLEDYYYDLFLEYVYAEDDVIRLENMKEEMESTSNKLNDFLDKIDEILSFFQENDDDLEFTGDNLVNFEDDEISESYEQLYAELLEIASNFIMVEADASNEV